MFRPDALRRSRRRGVAYPHTQEELHIPIRRSERTSSSVPVSHRRTIACGIFDADDNYRGIDSAMRCHRRSLS